MAKFNQIFCDMDGVLVDFYSGMNRNITRLLNDTEGQEALGPKLSKLLEQTRQEMAIHGMEVFELDKFEDRKPIRKLTMTYISRDPETAFFDLPRLDDGVTDLWQHLHTYGAKVSILSAPVPDRRGSFGPARRGKTSWVEAHLDPQPSGIFITPANEKWKHALTDGVPNILVDDNVKNITEWCEAGGIGFLHLPGKSQETIREMKKLLTAE